ncbi:MAG: hypothetical protein K2G44_04660 [Clostridia bacterium]|nr:hypothetical protein [Clostridia bacterium]
MKFGNNVKFRKLVKFSMKALPFILVAVIVLTVIFFPHPKADEPTQKRVVRIWNVDTFEGGKGSRTSFLRRVALKAEKVNEGVYYFISSYSLEGANAAFEAGESPDLLSFGIGLSAFAEKSLPLPYLFAGGNTDAGCLAYPWCGGGYYLFSLTENFEEKGTTVISKGGNNLPEVAASMAGITGEFAESNAAYVGFLSGKYRYLLGTQRDECRFATRGVNVYKKPLEKYCDLYQYVSVLSAKKRADCNAFLDVLFSAETQQELSDIGMYSAKRVDGMKTVSVFSEEDALKTITQIALGGAEIKNLDKFLKTI